jgi:hypothetical protein
MHIILFFNHYIYIGDFFVVKMTEDHVYGTPVFTTIGGKSKCPGETGTLRREDDVTIEIIDRCKDSNTYNNGKYKYNKACMNVESGDMAFFSVIITNMSPTSKINKFTHTFISIYLFI